MVHKCLPTLGWLVWLSTTESKSILDAHAITRNDRDNLNMFTSAFSRKDRENLNMFPSAFSRKNRDNLNMCPSESKCIVWKDRFLQTVQVFHEIVEDYPLLWRLRNEALFERMVAANDRQEQSMFDNGFAAFVSNSYSSSCLLQC